MLLVKKRLPLAQLIQANIDALKTEIDACVRAVIDEGQFSSAIGDLQYHDAMRRALEELLRISSKAKPKAIRAGRKLVTIARKK